MKTKITTETVRAISARYLKIVEWSNEDGCFVGRAPGLFFGGCHGDDERKVYLELCDIVEEHVEHLLSKNEPLPAPTAGKQYSGKFNVRIGPDLHQKATMLAMAWGISLNQVVANALASNIGPSYPTGGTLALEEPDLVVEESVKRLTRFRKRANIETVRQSQTAPASVPNLVRKRS